MTGTGSPGGSIATVRIGLKDTHAWKIAAHGGILMNGECQSPFQASQNTSSYSPSRKKDNGARFAIVL